LSIEYGSFAIDGSYSLSSIESPTETITSKEKICDLQKPTIGGEFKSGPWLFGGWYGVTDTKRVISIYFGQPEVKHDAVAGAFYLGYDFLPAKDATLALLASYSFFSHEKTFEYSYGWDYWYEHGFEKRNITVDSLGLGVKYGRQIGRFNFELLFHYGIDDHMEYEYYDIYEFKDIEYPDGFVYEDTEKRKCDGDYKGYFIKLGYRITDNLNLKL